MFKHKNRYALRDVISEPVGMRHHCGSNIAGQVYGVMVVSEGFEGVGLVDTERESGDARLRNTDCR